MREREGKREGEREKKRKKERDGELGRVGEGERRQKNLFKCSSSNNLKYGDAKQACIDRKIS